MSIPKVSAGAGNIYLGDKVVAKSGCENRILYDETDYSSSSYGVNGKLFLESGGWTKASITTRDGFPVLQAINNSHISSDISMSNANHNQFVSHKKLKIIADYIAMIPSGNTYGGGCGLSEIYERFWYAYGTRYHGATSNQRTSFIPESGVGYKIEQIVDTSDLSCKTKFIKLSNNTETILQYTKTFQTNRQSSTAVHYGTITRDQSCSMWLGNIHLYYSD